MKKVILGSNAVFVMLANLFRYHGRKHKKKRQNSYRVMGTKGYHGSLSKKEPCLIYASCRYHNGRESSSSQHYPL